MANQKAGDQGKKSRRLKKTGAKTKVQQVELKPEAKPVFIKKASDFLLVLMLVVVSLLLFIGPFYRGLFFTPELRVANIVIFGLLCIWGLYRLTSADKNFGGSLLDLCLLLLLLSYLVSFIGFAVSKREALEELLKIASYVVVYLVTLELCRHFPAGFFRQKNNHNKDPEAKEKSALPSGLNLVLHIILASTFVITVASLGVPAGNWDFIGAYAGNRIASPMGYANTAAAYLMAAYFLALGLAPLAKNKLKIIYLGPAALMLMSVILTFSRGAWLMLLPLFVLFILVCAPMHRLRAGLSVVITALVALPAAFWADMLFRSANPQAGWLPVVLAFLGALLLGYAVELFLSLPAKKIAKVALAAAILLLIILVVFVLLPLAGPLTLETKAGEPEKLQSLKQAVSSIEPGAKYQLALEVKAETKPFNEDEPADYAWGLKVFEGHPGYSRTELVNYFGPGAGKWQALSYDFVTGQEAERLSVELYNRYPGTKVTVRSVRLITVDGEKKLRFVLGRLLPERFYDRIISFSRNSSMERRFELFVDALKVIKDYPLFGLGGGGWAAVYKSYQDQAYSSREVHNHFLQVWIEAGFVGFIAFVGLWLALSLAFVKKALVKKAPPAIRQYWTAVFMPVAALGVHSLIDWNFSMAAVGIFLFALLGAGRSLAGEQAAQVSDKTKTGNLKSVFPALAGLTLGLALFIYTLVLFSGLKATIQSQEYIESGNIKMALAKIEKAIALDPYRADNYHNYNALIEEQALRSQNQREINKVFDLAKRAHELEPYNANYLSRYGSLIFSYVDPDEGLEYLDRVIEVGPYYETGYRQSALFRLSLIEYFAGNKQPAQALKYYNDLKDTATNMHSALGNTKAINYLLGRGAFLTGDYTEAARYLKLVDEDDQNYFEAQSILLSITEAVN